MIIDILVILQTPASTEFLFLRLLFSDSQTTIFSKIPSLPALSSAFGEDFTATLQQTNDPNPPIQQAAPAQTWDKPTQTPRSISKPLSAAVLPSPSPPFISENEEGLARTTRRVKQTKSMIPCHMKNWLLLRHPSRFLQNYHVEPKRLCR